MSTNFDGELHLVCNELKILLYHLWYQKEPKQYRQRNNNRMIAQTTFQ